MSRRSAFRNWAEFVPAWLLIHTLSWLPARTALRFAEGLAVSAMRFAPAWRRVADRNLRLAFPDAGELERARLVEGCFRNMGRVLWAIARAPGFNVPSMSDWIEYEGYEHYERALAQWRGVLFLTAHLGCWELSSAAHALFGNPMTVLVRPLDNPLMDAFLDRRRSSHGNRTLRKQNSAREILQALHANQPVGILADQNTAGEDGLFVDVFGVPAAASKGVAQIAMKTGAAVIPGFAFWNPKARQFVLRFAAPLEMRDSGDRDADLAENTQRCQTAIEQGVRAYPDQWLWIHRRWKRRPPGHPSIY